jgi:hypothetical protein
VDRVVAVLVMVDMLLVIQTPMIKVRRGATAEIAQKATVTTVMIQMMTSCHTHSRISGSSRDMIFQTVAIKAMAFHQTAAAWWPLPTIAAAVSAQRRSAAALITMLAVIKRGMVSPPE